MIEHDPGPRGSPHEPQAPVDAGHGAASLFPPVVPTANTDRSFCRFVLWHDGQLGEWPSRARNSNCWPQLLHAYSKSGIPLLYYAEALLGKVRALTYSGHYPDALTAIDALLALEHWYIGDARYWRAMNEVQLGLNDRAWEDVERAAELITNAEVPKLAGIIAVRRQQIPVARAKFEEARRRDDSDCEVPFYLGTVLVEEREWARSVEVFIAAAGCFDRSQKAIEGQIARIRASSTPAAAERRAKQIARREQQIEAQARMRATSWFDTAAACFNLMRYMEAREYAMHVIDDSQFGERARDLLARLPRGTP